MWVVELLPRAVGWLEGGCSPQADDRVKVRAGFERVFALLEEFGPIVGAPHVDYLGEGLWEARYRHRRTAYRMFYCQHGTTYLVVGGAVKKAQRLRPDILKTAHRWCEEAILKHEGRPNP